MTQPSVGRIVHYVSYGTPGGEYASKCRAAIVAETLRSHGGADDSERHHYDAEEWCRLVVLNPKGIFFDACKHDEDRAPGTWHWPERVPGDVPPASSGGSDG